MSTYTTDVFCLKAMDYREADKILTLYSPDIGLISAIAKGVKRPKSKLAGACSLLHLSRVQLIKGKKLDTLSQYESLESFSELRKDILKLAFGMLFAEQVFLMGIEHDGESQDVFNLLKETLKHLQDVPPELILPIATKFQVTLLEIAGYQPQLVDCILCAEPIDFQRVYYPFSPELGGILCRKCDHQSLLSPPVNVSTSTLKVIQDPLTQDWETINGYKVQKFIHYYLSKKLDRNIRSYDFVLGLLEVGK
jgi:DNA repair protein RecO (recombination protein O)